MCWNETISLNTFIFSVAVMGFIYYNNTYTKYKIEEFKNPFMYIFMISVSIMQLIEYFLWKAIQTNNHKMNNIFSIIGSLVLLFQPYTLSLMINDNTIRYFVSNFYLLFAIPFIGFKYYGNLDKFTTSVSNKSNGLRWEWFLDFKYEWLGVMMYWIIALPSLYYLPRPFSIFILTTLFITFIGYRLVENKFMSWTWGSKWCWTLNLFMLYYLIKLMIVIPFKDMKSNLFCK